MPNVDQDHEGDGATHSACLDQIQTLGEAAPCCDCSKHECTYTIRDVKGRIVRALEQDGAGYISNEATIRHPNGDPDEIHEKFEEVITVMGDTDCGKAWLVCIKEIDL